MVSYYCLFVCNIKTSSEGSRFHLPHVLFMFCFNVLFGGLDVLSIGGRIDRKVWSVLTSIKSLSNPVSFNLFHSTQYIILPSLILYSDIVLLSLSETPAKITLFQNGILPLLMDQILEEIIRVELSIANSKLSSPFKLLTVISHISSSV